MGKPCELGCTCGKHRGKEYAGKRVLNGYCVPGCECNRHKKCEPGCSCAKHSRETRLSQSAGQRRYMELAEKVTCECGAGPFTGLRGLTTHQRVSQVHGSTPPRLGTGKKASR